MAIIRQLRRFLRTRIGVCSVMLVVACGLMLGTFVARTFVNPLPPKYNLDLGNARWIEHSQFSPHAFFRKEIFLSSPVQQAWIQIAATDHFELSVNGRALSPEAFVSARVTGLYDLKTHLQPGKNVIGVRVERKSFPGPAQVCVRAMLKAAGGGAWTEILSDENWKAAADTAAIPTGTPWNSPLIEDARWANAKRSEIARASRMLQIQFNPRLLEMQPEGEWLAARNANDRERRFITRLDLKRGSQETWLQIAATGAYDLVINGDLVASETIPDQAGIVQPAVRSIGSVPALQAFYITPWLRSGANDILICVRPERAAAALLADGFTVNPDGTIQRIKTDSTWSTVERLSGGDARTERAVTVARYGQPPMGLLEQRMARPSSLPAYDVEVAARWAFTLIPITAFTLFLWLACSGLISHRNGSPLPRALARDALLHVPLLSAMTIVLLLRYDIRLTENWPFQPMFVAVFLGALLGLRWLHLILAGAGEKTLTLADVRAGLGRYAYPIMLAAIVVLGFGLRLHDIGYCSFDHDEIGLVDKSQGVIERGFPYHMIGSHFKPLTTYELVPYPLALSGAIFGYSEWSMRLPACLFGTASILLVGMMGRRMFHWRVALVAALIYACLPLNIRWSQNAFYPAQAQFFALLLFWTFYEAIRTRPFHRGYLTVAAIAFCCTYLSWEGSGFLLPALFVALLATRWGQWWWLKDGYLYKCLFFMCVIVIAQLCYRTLWNERYLMIGSGLSTVSTPSLFFLNANYNPWFYVQKLLLGENHVLFTLVVAVGVVFCWRNLPIRYCLVMMATLLACYTNLLSADSPRYCYIYQPLLLIAAVAIVFQFIDQLVVLAIRAGQTRSWTRFAYANGIIAIGLLFVASNSWALKAYRLAFAPEDPSMNYRMGTYRVDYRSADLFVKEHVRPGDIVIPGIPHAYEYYTGLSGHYFLNTLLSSRLWYDATTGDPRYVDKFRGLPVLRSLKELEDVTHRHGRTWIISAPTGYFMRNQSEVLQYLNDHTKVMYQSYNAKVLLFEGAGQPPPLQSAKN